MKQLAEGNYNVALAARNDRVLAGSGRLDLRQLPEAIGAEIADSELVAHSALVHPELPGRASARPAAAVRRWRPSGRPRHMYRSSVSVAASVVRHS